MEKNQNLKLVKRTALTLILAALALPGFAQQPTAAEHAAMLKATLAARQSTQVSRASGEAKETAAEEAHESRQVQAAEGELGRNVNAYA